MVKTSNTEFTCIMDLQVTGWNEKTLASGLPGFVVDSGHVGVSAPTANEGEFCIYVSFPAGTVNPYTGNVIAPINTLIPAAVGTYSLNGYGQLKAQASVIMTFTA